MALSVTKNAAPLNVEPGSIVTYTVDIDATVNDENNVVFTDIIPNGMTFIEGSFKLDGIQIVSANPNNGVPIGNIGVGTGKQVIFQCLIDDNPDVVTITNTSTATSDADIDSGSVTIDILIINVVKTADKQVVNIGDTITYRIDVINVGNVPITAVSFEDVIPICTSFVANTVIINGTPTAGDPTLAPIIVPSPINPGASAVITFEVTVTCLPTSCFPIFKNCATINYSYDSGIAIIDKTEEACVSVTGPTSFKQLSVDENLTIPPQKPDAEQILNAVVDITITETNIIETIISTSYEGQILTGFKVIVEGRLNQYIEYVADEPAQSVHAAEFSTPFSTFIVLPENYVYGTPVQIESFVEDVFYKLLDKRTIFKNVTFRLLAKCEY